MFLQTVSILFLSAVLFGCLEGKGVQMQRDVQCCMQYSYDKVRTKDVLRYERQTEGPDCSIRAIILYTKKAVKCADPSDRKVKRLLRKLNQRMGAKARRTMWLHPHMNLPVMSEVAVVNSQKMNKLCVMNSSLKTKI
uniref:Chemokine (C-C motif) ligand 44 n=1 Tax=Cyprinus carpio TaxID=7962 RepID=A0A8C1ZG84_CYPCA